MLTSTTSPKSTVRRKTRYPSIRDPDELRDADHQRDREHEPGAAPGRSRAGSRASTRTSSARVPIRRHRLSTATSVAARPGEVREQADHEAAGDREPQGERQRESRGRCGSTLRASIRRSQGRLTASSATTCGAARDGSCRSRAWGTRVGERSSAANAAGEGDERERRGAASSHRVCPRCHWVNSPAWMAADSTAQVVARAVRVAPGRRAQARVPRSARAPRASTPGGGRPKARRRRLGRDASRSRFPRRPSSPATRCSSASRSRRSSADPACSSRIDGFEKWDNERVQPLARRAPAAGLTDLSWVGSTLAGGLVIPAVVGVLLVVVPREAPLAPGRVHPLRDLRRVRRRTGRRRSSSTATGPPVHRLESLPANASFPSGHIAATVALYGGPAAPARFAGRSVAGPGSLSWLLAVAFPLFVGSARMYRGMHHLLDSAGGSRSWASSRCGDRRVRRPRGGRRPRTRASARGGGIVKNVAVIAHAGKTIGGGLEELRRDARARRVSPIRLVRGAEEQVRARACRAGARRGRRACVRLGRRRDGAAVRRRAGRERRARSRSSRPGTANLFASNLGIPQDIAEAVEIGLRGRATHARRRQAQRRALRRDGGSRPRRPHDPGGRRTPQGPLRPPRVHLDGVEEPPCRALRGDDRSQRRALVRGHGELHPRSGTSARSSAASRRSTTRARRTACSRSA